MLIFSGLKESQYHYDLGYQRPALHTPKIFLAAKPRKMHEMLVWIPQLSFHEAEHPNNDSHKQLEYVQVQFLDEYLQSSDASYGNVHSGNLKFQ